jgi:uncharacterized delta-60 repeat protein
VAQRVKTPQLVSAVLIAFGVMFGATSSVEAAAGDLDPTFGNGGLVTTDFSSRSDFGAAVAIQSDARIVTAGNSSAVGVFGVDFALARYHPNGNLDASFGSGGIVRSDFGAPLDAAADVALQLDGKIVAAGVSAGDFAVARYNANGSLDSSFGTGGFVRTDFGSFDQATALALQSDGKVVVVGFGLGSFAVARYNADGLLDSTFGSGGKVTTGFGLAGAAAFDVAVASTGEIVVGGGTGLFPFGPGDFAIARYESDGALDSSFGTGGTATTDFGGSDRAFAIALQSDGRVTAAGGTRTSTSDDFALARYNSDGSLDASFGAGGTVTTDFSSNSQDIAFGVVLNADGWITAAGSTSVPPSSSRFALARYNSSGSLDFDFGSGGKVTTTFGHPTNNGADIAAQTDGKVVVVGVTADFAAGVADFALARYLGPPRAMTVVLDVKPGNEENTLPLKSNGVVSVAILTTDALDATTVDPASVCFGNSDDPSSRDCTEKHGTGHLEDVNGDGRTDLLLHYEVAETGIAPGDTQACLSGRTYGGVAIEGCDHVSTT